MGTAIRLLFVEDDPALARVLTRVVRMQGVDATIVTSAEAGLAVIEGGGVDAVICDEHLDTGHSGTVLLEHVREHAPHAVRVLASGERVDALAAAARSTGLVDVFLPKPYTVAQIGDVLALVHGRVKRSP